MKKILFLSLAAVGVAMTPIPKASAGTVACQSGPTALPATVSNHYVVIVDERGRRYYRHRHAVWYHGHRHYTYARVYL